jgi:hypothetical protein
MIFAILGGIIQGDSMSKPFRAHRLAILALIPFLAWTAFAGPVISWVAPYRVDQTKAMLQRDFGGVGMKDGLTWLALQFWIDDGPGLKQDGSVAGPNFDATVKWFRDWGHANGIKVTLCVTDYVGGWNWAEARRSFNDNRAAFVKSLVDEAARLQLDGVELDLEGEGDPTAAEMTGYNAMAADLAAALHAQGKTLTAASYPAQWNAPNWKMWPDLMKVVDGVTSMGYEQTGKGSTNGFNYADQKKHAAPDKLMIGMPGYHGNWEGNTALEQLDWVLQDGTTGVGIWDASLADPAWQTAAVWNKLKAIKAQKAIDVKRPLAAAVVPEAKPAAEAVDTNGRIVDQPRHTPMFRKRGAALR